MTEEKKQRSVISRSSDPGVMKSMTRQLRLVLRLMGDKRVSFLFKLLPLGSLAYLIMPADVLPLNPIDDAIIIGIGTYMFIEMCPQDVVEEHRKALSGGDEEEPSVEVVDVEFNESAEE